MANVTRPFLAALAFGCAIGAGAASPAAAQTALPKNSPFMPAAGSAQVSNGPVENIEFAAVRTIGQRTEIDLYDTQGKKNHWIPLGGTVDGLTVVGYDARRDEVTATIGGVNKLLKLRQTRGVAANVVAVTTGPVMSFATPTQPTSIAAPLPVVVAPRKVIVEGPANPVPPEITSSPATPEGAKPPAVPLSIARQEEEARMLVSDLLEIGMAQRKAYEEKQRQAADPNAAPKTPEATPTQPQPAPGGPPSGN